MRRARGKAKCEYYVEFMNCGDPWNVIFFVWGRGGKRRLPKLNPSPKKKKKTKRSLQFVKQNPNLSEKMLRIQKLNTYIYNAKIYHVLEIFELKFNTFDL